jgi:hypothetical protein
VSDWATVLGTLGGVLVGSGASLWGAGRGRHHDDRMARSARVEAQRAWHRDNRAAAYVTVLEIAEKVGNVVALAFPMVDTIPPAPLPDLPTLGEQAHAAARMKVFASDSVLSAYDAWDGIARQALRTIEAIDRDLAAVDERKSLDRLRGEENRAFGLLSRAMAADLAASPE